MKKFILFVVCGMMTFAAVACTDEEVVKKQDVASSEEKVQLPNPFVDCETLEQGEKVAGFEISLPENLPEGFQQATIRGIENNLIEIVYTNGEDEICIRKAKGEEDISGDYNTYKENDTLEFEGFTVAIKGDNGKRNVASWVVDEYSYAISVNPSGEGIDEDSLINMIENIR